MSLHFLFAADHFAYCLLLTILPIYSILLKHSSLPGAHVLVLSVLWYRHIAHQQSSNLPSLLAKQTIPAILQKLLREHFYNTTQIRPVPLEVHTLW